MGAKAAGTSTDKIEKVFAFIAREATAAKGEFPSKEKIGAYAIHTLKISAAGFHRAAAMVEEHMEDVEAKKKGEHHEEKHEHEEHDEEKHEHHEEHEEHEEKKHHEEHKPMPKKGKDTHKHKPMPKKGKDTPVHKPAHAPAGIRKKMNAFKASQAKKLVSDHLAGHATAKKIVDSIPNHPKHSKGQSSTTKKLAAASKFEKKVTAWNKAAPKKAAKKAARKAAKHAAHKKEQKAEKVAKKKAAKKAFKKAIKKAKKAAKKAAVKAATKKAKKIAKKVAKKAAKKKKADLLNKMFGMMETGGKNTNERHQKAARVANKEVANKQTSERHTKDATRTSNAERRVKTFNKTSNTCTVTVYDGPNYTGHVLSRQSTCASKKSYHLPRHNGRRRAYRASSFKLSSGCVKVRLWDEDKCRENYSDNVDITASVPKLTYDLNDDVCAVTVWANRNGHCRL